MVHPDAAAGGAAGEVGIECHLTSTCAMPEYDIRWNWQKDERLSTDASLGGFGLAKRARADHAAQIETQPEQTQSQSYAGRFVLSDADQFDPAQGGQLSGHPEALGLPKPITHCA
jgi:hypothetical protein